MMLESRWKRSLACFFSFAVAALSPECTTGSARRSVGLWRNRCWSHYCLLGCKTGAATWSCWNPSGAPGRHGYRGPLSHRPRTFRSVGVMRARFYLRAAAHYGVNDLDHRANWLSEPHVDEAIFNAMLREASVTVVLHHRIRDTGGVTVEKRHVVELITEDGESWRAKVFADCSYEGDLMAQAGVHYTWGARSGQEYGESLAGVREHTPAHQFNVAALGIRPATCSLPGDRPRDRLRRRLRRQKSAGLQLSVVLTNDPANRIPFPRPEGYDRCALRSARAPILPISAAPWTRAASEGLLQPGPNSEPQG